MDFDLRLVRYFVVVADELHFGRAAARLYVSQPALSKQIRKLEDTVGEQLLVRDSRHVRLTPRGERFLEDARQLLTIAERMSHPHDLNVLRIAHIFELTTGREVVDAFTAPNPSIEVVERSMDSYRQLDALLNNQLDVAILRVTRQMVAEHPAGWHYRMLRLEPMLLVGRPGDPQQDGASFHERPIEVFADAAGSGMYNAHGEFLTAFERDTGIVLRWLGNPGTFNHCLSAVMRARDPALVLEFASYAERYSEVGLPVYNPTERRPVYPWSIAWRDEQLSEPVAEFVRTAHQLARSKRWTAPTVSLAPMWLPPDDPAISVLTPPSSTGRTTSSPPDAAEH
jgi:DNA-binding transcriptional LysR family regulator